MSFKHFFRPFLGAMALVVASACSDTTGPSFDGSFSESEGEEMAWHVQWELEYALNQLSFGRPGAGAAVSKPPLARGPRAAAVAELIAAVHAAAPGCSVSATGAGEDPFEPYDGNDNGIGDDYSVVYECVEVDTIGEGVLRTERETYRMRVKERTDLLWGYDEENSYSVREDVTDGDSWEENNRWEAHLAIRADRASYRFVSRGSGFDEEDGVVYPYSWGDEADIAFTPADPIATGEDLPDGLLTATGRGYYDYGAGEALDFRLDTPEPLVYSAECFENEDQRFVGGTLRGRLNGNAEKGFLFTYGSCTNGAALEIFGDGEPAED